MNTLPQQIENSNRPGKTARFDRAEIIRALTRYTDGPFEIRIIDAVIGGRTGIAFGYFGSAERAADEIAKVQSWVSVYFIPNPIDAALLARRKDRIALAGKRDGQTADKDILRPRWLLIDADPIRPSGISSTDDQHAAALDCIRRVNEYLAQNGWPEGIIADSGNGGHLCFHIDLPADDGGLVSRVLTALAELFNNDTVKIDTTASNPARNWKLPGTLACKGDSTPDRPHRMARILSAPDTLTVVLPDQLGHIAAQARPVTPPAQHVASGPATAFDAEDWIRRHEKDADGPHTWNDGRKWILPVCAFDASHNGGCAVIIQHGSGAMDYTCRHDSCKAKRWAEYRELRDPGYRQPRADRQWAADAAGPGQSVEDFGDLPDLPAVTTTGLAIEDAAEMIAANPEMRRAVIEGKLREREIANFVSNSKAGKTFLALGLALDIVTERAWLDRFAVAAGNVLYVDCELHRQTLSRRLDAIAKARGILTDQYAGKLKILSLRGRLKTLYELESFFRAIEPGRFKVIFLDSLYRLWPAGMDENSNSDVTAVYNRLDVFAELTGAAFICIGHTSKGNQSGKAVADVGSGAGAQSRAVDSHIVLRAHELDDVVVMESIARSFAPSDPICLRWQYPLWAVDDSLDPTRLREPGQRGAESRPMTPADFTEKYLNGEAIPRNLLMAKARASGQPERRLDELLALAQNDGLIAVRPDAKDGRKMLYYKVHPK